MDKLPKGISQRGATYRVSVMVNGKRKTATAKTLEQAVQVKDNIKAGLYNFEHAAGTFKTWNVNECFEHYIDYRLSVSPDTLIPHYRWMGRTLVNFFGATTSLEDVNERAIERFFDYLTLEKKYSSSIVNGLGTMLYKMQQRAHKRGRMLNIPVRMQGVKHTLGRVRFLSTDEEAMALEWYKNTARDDFHDLFIFYVDTGVRKKEALNLKWDDIDLKTGRITLWKTKTNKPRTIRMTRRVRSIVTKLYTSRRMTQRGVFTHISERKFYIAWREMRRYLGLENDRQFVIHMLRHTCCTRLLGAGVDIRSVMEWMGHSSIEMTQRYAHFIPSKLDGAVKALDQLAETNQTEKANDFIRLAKG